MEHGSVKCKGNMDLRTDYCHAGSVPGSSLATHPRRLNVIILLLARRMPAERRGEAFISQADDIA